jgi:aspartate/methionine/tyrosine aminotransferase
MPSRRLPPTFEPNPWSRRLEEHRASGAALLDLTEANPTRTGLMALGPAERAALADPRGAAYEPDPRGLEAAREAIAAYHASRGAAVDPDRIVLTSGTSEAYAHLFRLAADPGERILVPRPSYPLFEPIAALEGVAVRDYRLEYDGRWRIDLDQLETAIDAATRALVVVQPNHPTGSCPDAGEREQLKALCARHDLMLISDEVFGDHGWDGTPLPTLAAAGPATTFVLGGLSKACGLPQLKLSWIAAAGPERSVAEALAALEWIADLFLSVSTPVQVALPRLLGARDAFQSRARARIAANRARLEDRSRAVPRSWSCPPTGAGWRRCACRARARKRSGASSSCAATCWSIRVTSTTSRTRPTPSSAWWWRKRRSPRRCHGSRRCWRKPDAGGGGARRRGRALSARRAPDADAAAG